MEPLEIILPEEKFIKEYFVDKYDDLCEQHFKIKKIVALKSPRWKKILNIFLNIITVLFINYIYGFFNRLVKVMKYDECTLDEAELLGIYCNDGQFYFVELKKIDLPKVDNPDVLTSQSNSSKRCFLFTFKLFNYIYNPNTKSFNSIKYSIYHTKEEIFNLMRNGLNINERIYQKHIYGECDLFFHIDSFFRALFKNTCNFFFAFQIYAIILWSTEDYYTYAALIAAMTIFDLLEETITNQSNLKSIRNMAKYSIPIKIYQKKEDGLFDIINEQSVNIVPGDIFEIPDDGMAIPCDCILLSGSVIINEAMLTGESTPIIKSHLPNIKQNFDEEMDNKYFLYAGTKIVQKRAENKKPIIALAYSTGFNSVKGNLIRSILYPVESDSKFAQESAKFIILLAIVCIVGFASVLPSKISRIEKYDDKEERIEAYKDLIHQFFDLMTTAVPPSLPCCLGVGIGIAQKRFKKKGIMCINRDKIIYAGKINICVFDKTGTLTEDHLNIAGFLPVEAHQKSENEIYLDSYNSHNVFIFDQFYDSVKNLSNKNFEYYKSKCVNKEIITKKKELIELYIECLACCQGITRVNGKLIGDPIDVEMFESTGWELIEEPEDVNNYDPKITTFVRPAEEKSLTEKLKGLEGFLKDPNNEEIKDKIKDHYELGIIRRFDFSSKLQRMSTLVKNLNQDNITCYVKGSPEKIKELCQLKTIPSDFNEQLNNYTSRGYRVLAMGSKVINMDINKAFEVNRTFCEKDLIFLGLLIVQNKLKEATNPTLKILSQDAHIRVKMATGDNIMTAVCVGRKSNLIEPNAIVYSCEIETENENKIEENNPLNQRISIGAYENRLNIEKEKENKKKRLIWKTIESYKEEDVKNSLNNKNDLAKEDNIEERISNNNRLSSLLPQEVTEEDIKIEDENNAILKTANKLEEKDITEDEEDEILEIDLNTVPFKEDQENDIEIAITGKTFETLYKLNQKYEKLYKNNNIISLKHERTESDFNKDNINPLEESFISTNIDINADKNKITHFKAFHDAFRLILKYCSIYARCSPENKTQIVQSLQKESFTVLMCGDGANDCGALKVADVGISLSTEEASIAAPFTSKTPDISCVIDVLKEGKSALVTCIQTFKYIILYSLIQFISCTILMFSDSYLSNWEFMASDLFLITPLAFLIPLAPSYHKLTYHRPVSSLFSFPILFSMFLQIIFVIGFQVLVEILTSEFFPKKYFKNYRECVGVFDNFKKWPDGGIFEEDISYDQEINENDEDGPYQECIDNSSIFYISFAQYLILAVVFCTGKPFKKNIFHNYGMLIFSILGFIYSEYIVFYVDYFTRFFYYSPAYPDDPFVNYYLLNNNQKNHHSFPFKYCIMIIIVINFIVSFFIEKFVVSKCYKIWKKYQMKRIRQNLEMDKDKEADLNLINNVKNYTREQKKIKKDT